MKILNGLLGLGVTWLGLAFWFGLFGVSLYNFTIGFFSVLLFLVVIGYAIAHHKTSDKNKLPGTQDQSSDDQTKKKKIPTVAKAAAGAYVGYKVGKKISKW